MQGKTAVARHPTPVTAVQADQGSNHFAATVRAIKTAAPSLLVECLTPDFRGDAACIDTVATR